MDIKFKGKIRKVGNSHVVTIPADYINNKLLNTEQEYHFTTEQEDNNAQ